MAKRGRPRGSGRKPASGEQLPLIDVGPENSEEIAVHIRLYRDALSKRLKYLKVEIKEKIKILDLVKEAKLIPLEDGTIRFKCADMLINVTPRDFLIKLKDEGEEQKADKSKSMQQTVTETEKSQ